MKTKIISLLSLALLLWTCKKDDNIKPLLSITGKDTVKIELNSKYTEPGFTATDDTDGDISSKVVVKSNLNIDKVGYYELYYSVADESGNISESPKRIVYVYNSSNIYNGTWDSKDTSLFPSKGAFDITLLADSFTNNKINFSRLSSQSIYSSYCMVSSEVIEFPLQTVKYNDSLSLTLQGNGAILDSNRILIHYLEFSESVVSFNKVTLNREP